MRPLAFIATYERLRQAPAWRLLASHSAPMVLGLLRALLLEKERQLPGAVLHERLETELDELRARGVAITGTSAYYIRDWLREGWLERRLPEGAEEEEYELSAEALRAIRSLEQLDTPRAAATESRLALVTGELVQLAHVTAMDPSERLEHLYAERRRLDARIDAALGGEVEVLDEDRAVERLRDVLSLAAELTEDFRRVRDDFAGINREFTERVISDAGQRGQLLADLFAGVDVIAESPQGRSFSAFWTLLNDPEQSAQLDASISALLRRDFARRLPREARLFLVNFTRTLLDRAGSVHRVHNRFARSLRSFVQGREYREHRRMMGLLKNAKAAALPLRDSIRPEAQTGVLLRLSTASLNSIGTRRLHEPVEPMLPDPLVPEAVDAPALEMLYAAIAQSDIDFRALRANVRTLLSERSQCSIGSLIERFSAPQGLGTVIGYLALGVEHGELAPHRAETVAWSTADGQPRQARVPMVYFLPDCMEAIDG